MQDNLSYWLKTLLLLVFLLVSIVFVWGWSFESPQWPAIYNLMTQQSLEETDRYILLDLRLPRLAVGLLSGMMLAGSGLILQGFFRNPLMDPFILGVSGGGALGAGVAILLGFEFWFYGLSPVTLFALMGSLIVVAWVYRLGHFRKSLMIDRLLLAGVALSSLCSALLSFILVIKGKGLDQVVYWIMGSLNAKSWQDFGTLVPFALIGFALMIPCLHALNLMQTGQETAQSLGLNAKKSQWFLVLSAAILSAAVVSVCGVIGFIGLMVPHMARLWIKSSDFRLLCVPCLLLGGILFLWADAISRNLLASQEIPVGIFTALLGVPFFLAQLNQEAV